MILKKITIENIRSYKNAVIELPSGSTLLAGDIGSGKTSILLAIEFALFGLQPGQKGAALVRSTESNASVSIEFEIDGKTILIERSIKKGKAFSQDYCSIEIDGQKQEIAVSELKNRVLEILNYPPEFSKKQNLLYKFTVYTPQESMKQIILEDSSTRLDILRHIFGIDKYRRILDNSSFLISKLREEQRKKEGFTSDIEDKRILLFNKENEIEDKHKNLYSMEKELFSRIEIRKKIQEEINEIEDKIEEKKKYEKEIEKTNIMMINKKETIAINNKEIKNISLQVDEFQKLFFDEKKLIELENKIKKLKIEKENYNKNLLITISEISSLNIKSAEQNEIKIKISSIKLCPTCLQNVDDSYKANVLNKLETDISSNSKRSLELNNEKSKIEDQVKKINDEIIQSEGDLSYLRTLRIKLESLVEKQKRIELLQQSNQFLEKDLDILEKHIESLKKFILEYTKFEKIFDEKDSALQSALKEEKQAEIKVAEIKKEIYLFEKQVQDLQEEINKKEIIKKEMEDLKELENWLSNNFIPLVSFVEKNVMAKLREEFSTLFNRWFSMLVSETLSVRLDETFTPIIEQQDYELDYSFLSGGERTAVALAYRLALNQVINSLLSKIKTRDLIILDEPTEGFSDQQLDRMRDVLQQLQVQQLILVSHEQKIESFVENIIKIKKDKGESSIVTS